MAVWSCFQAALVDFQRRTSAVRMSDAPVRGETDKYLDKNG